MLKAFEKTTVFALTTPSETALIDLKKEELAIAFHWFLRLENSKYKIPYPPRIAKNHKSHGEFLHALFVLCEGVNSRQRYLEHRFSNQN